MKRIGVMSDTHGVVPKQVYSFFADCDEIWHAGDCGPGVLKELEAFKPVRAVWGNIDDTVMHLTHSKISVFECEGLKVVMTHIGGYPRHYDTSVVGILEAVKPKIFVSGHSHILKVMWDKEMELLHINPGAAGRQGFHKVGTLVRFTIEDGDPKDLEILDFPKFEEA